MDKFDKLMQDIEDMNRLYELRPVMSTDPRDMRNRAKQFHSILSKEVNELVDIIHADMATDEDIQVAMADLIADVIIYCLSESVRYELPISRILSIVMCSNFTKLGQDGKPIKDHEDKFLKGPNFIPPEKAIHAALYPLWGRTDLIEKLYRTAYELREQGQLREPERKDT